MNDIPEKEILINNKLQQLGILIMGVGGGVFLSKFKLFSSTPGTSWDGVPASAICLIGVGVWSYTKWRNR